MGEVEKRKISNIDDVKLAFENVNFLEIDNYLFTRDLRLIDIDTEKEILFKDLSEAIDYVLNGKTILEHLKDITLMISLSGGRGANHNATMGGGFSSAGAGSGGKGRNLFPAEFNTQGRFVSQEEAMKMFIEKHKDSDIEYGFSVDTMGFVHAYVEGSETSVPISAKGKNHMVGHNHPQKLGNFSDADLLSTARDRLASGIFATAPDRTAVLNKGKNFDAAGFVVAVKKAKWPAHYNYEDGADWWLRKNAKKYDYSYSKRATSSYLK